jgi:L-iditol 2-dehydrogenase
VKAAFHYGVRDIRTENTADVQEPGPGEALVEVTAVGVCGSDLHGYVFGDVGGIVNQQPLILGHEAAGRIIALGPDAPDTMKVGQRVAIDPATPCMLCERCEAGEPHLCLSLKFMGLWPYHGALRERMVHPTRCLFPMPDNISDVGAAMLEPLGVALHGIRLANIRVGEDVAVIGCGAVGLLITRLARLNGARRIFVADRLNWRLDIAANFGADHLINIDQQDVVAEVMRLTNKRGVDVAIEAAWVEDTANQCVLMARFGGRVVIMGIPAKDELKIQASASRRKEVPIFYSRRMAHVYPTTSVLAHTGRVDVDALATHRFSLAQANDAFTMAADYQDGVIRAMICPTMK